MSSEQQTGINTPSPSETQVVDKTISVERANLYAIALMPALLGLVIIPYILRWGWSALGAALDEFADYGANLLTLGAALAAGIVVHEALHGVGWALSGRLGWEPIRFGFKSISPYCHCDAPMPASAYRLGTALPLLVLGVLPALAAALTGSVWLLVFAAMMTISAGGDVLILWLLRDVPGDASVQDHPNEVGCQILV